MLKVVTDYIITNVRKKLTTCIGLFFVTPAVMRRWKASKRCVRVRQCWPTLLHLSFVDLLHPLYLSPPLTLLTSFLHCSSLFIHPYSLIAFDTYIFFFIRPFIHPILAFLHLSCYIFTYIFSLCDVNGWIKEKKVCVFNLSFLICVRMRERGK